MPHHVATGWPNACNMLRPTMLRSVKFKCCDRLAGACKCWANNVGMCGVEKLLSFGRGLTCQDFQTSSIRSHWKGERWSFCSHCSMNGARGINYLIFICVHTLISNTWLYNFFVDFKWAYKREFLWIKKRFGKNWWWVQDETTIQLCWRHVISLGI